MILLIGYFVRLVLQFWRYAFYLSFLSVIVFNMRLMLHQAVGSLMIATTEFVLWLFQFLDYILYHLSWAVAFAFWYRPRNCIWLNHPSCGRLISDKRDYLFDFFVHFQSNKVNWAFDFFVIFRRVTNFAPFLIALRMRPNLLIKRDQFLWLGF
jgi:hypothetical protein